MKHLASLEDVEFRKSVEECSFPPAQFNHRAHIRLAYVYLCENDVEQSHVLMRNTLLRLLKHNGIPISKYHETMTRAWILAVRHFMDSGSGYGSADDFMADRPLLLDSKIMLTHYSAEVLFSDAARAVHPA